MTLGYSGTLFILAFDHRTPLQRDLFGSVGEPSQEQALTISRAKGLILEGLKRSLDKGVAKRSAAILIDEQFGADVARRAKEEGIGLALAVERSGQKEFDFEYGADFPSHIERFDPDFCKALLRYNPEGDRALNRRQAQRLRDLSDWLAGRKSRLMVELLLPPEPDQLERVGGDTIRFDRELRPKLMIDAIVELQEAGVEADVWKIEGIDSRQNCEALARAAAALRSGPGRQDPINIQTTKAALNKDQSSLTALNVHVW
ncbi:MAG: hypothetical protein QOH48_1424 [Actinomycetota bacterium]|jgi:myo-inositol catabolism protein IolC|nr:hypothetical protein [Actinomycetota bacterium]